MYFIIRKDQFIPWRGWSFRITKYTTYWQKILLLCLPQPWNVWVGRSLGCAQNLEFLSGADHAVKVIFGDLSSKSDFLN
jgi:hypothetical protein